MKNNNRGMTLVEALVANVILIVAIYAALTIFNDTIGSQIFLERGLNFVVARNRVLSHLLDEKTWESTTRAADNAAVFTCMLNQDQPAAGLRNCAPVSNARFNVYALDTTRVFQTLSPTFGFDNFGKECTTFVAPPGAGNGACALGVDVRVTAQCEPAATDCTNPTLLFTGQHTYNNSETRYPLNVQPFNFSFIASGLFCPTQPAQAGLVGDAQINANATQVQGKSVPAQDGHYARSTAELLPCRNVGADFVITSANYDLAKVGNQTVVCLAENATGTCLLSFVHKSEVAGLTYELRDGATVVSSKPSWMALVGTESYRFEVVNGLAKFCVEGRCLHYFEKKIVAPFRFQIEPGYVTTPGQVMVDGFATSVDEL